MQDFSPRNLIGLSTEPLLMYPTHYVGDNGYISDTEDTLSFQGESVDKYRKEKELEIEREKAEKNSPKTEADKIQPKKDESRSSADDTVAHGEL